MTKALPIPTLLSRRACLAATGTALLAAALPRQAAAQDADFFTFDTLYKSVGVLGIIYSDRLIAAKGKRITINGYMAPPLRAESDFFVLTREPMAICPFCQSDAEWPVDILVVYLAAATPLVSGGTKIAVTGKLEIGSWTDPESGFVSQLRLRDAATHRL